MTAWAYLLVVVILSRYSLELVDSLLPVLVDGARSFGSELVSWSS